MTRPPSRSSPTRARSDLGSTRDLLLSSHAVFVSLPFAQVPLAPMPAVSAPGGLTISSLGLPPPPQPLPHGVMGGQPLLSPSPAAAAAAAAGAQAGFFTGLPQQGMTQPLLTPGLMSNGLTPGGFLTTPGPAVPGQSPSGLGSVADPSLLNALLSNPNLLTFLPNESSHSRPAGAGATQPLMLPAIPGANQVNSLAMPLAGGAGGAGWVPIVDGRPTGGTAAGGMSTFAQPVSDGFPESRLAHAVLLSPSRRWTPLAMTPTQGASASGKSWLPNP